MILPITNQPIMRLLWKTKNQGKNTPSLEEFNRGRWLHIFFFFFLLLFFPFRFFSFSSFKDKWSGSYKQSVDGTFLLLDDRAAREMGGVSMQTGEKEGKLVYKRETEPR